MTSDDASRTVGGNAGRTVVVGAHDLPGVWLDSDCAPGEKIIELLAHDGRVTTIVQRADGHLEICTDGLRASARSVRVATDGSAVPVRRRPR